MHATSHLNKSLTVALAFLVISGCSEYGTLPPQPVLKIDDIIELSKAGVGSGVIKRQIAVTHSQFRIETDDILRLKKAGVADDVIEAMIDTSEEAQSADLEKSYSLYDYWFNYYNTFYPLYLYDYPFSPYLYNAGDPYGFHGYTWSGTLGRYYRDFPVGLPKKGDTRYPDPEKIPTKARRDLNR